MTGERSGRCFPLEEPKEKKPWRLSATGRVRWSRLPTAALPGFSPCRHFKHSRLKAPGCSLTHLEPVPTAVKAKGLVGWILWDTSSVFSLSQDAAWRHGNTHSNYQKPTSSVLGPCCSQPLPAHAQIRYRFCVFEEKRIWCFSVCADTLIAIQSQIKPY